MLYIIYQIRLLIEEMELVNCSSIIHKKMEGNNDINIQMQLLVKLGMVLFLCVQMNIPWKTERP